MMSIYKFLFVISMRNSEIEEKYDDWNVLKQEIVFNEYNTKIPFFHEKEIYYVYMA